MRWRLSPHSAKRQQVPQPYGPRWRRCSPDLGMMSRAVAAKSCRRQAMASQARNAWPSRAPAAIAASAAASATLGCGTRRTATPICEPGRLRRATTGRGSAAKRANASTPLAKFPRHGSRKGEPTIGALRAAITRHAFTISATLPGGRRRDLGARQQGFAQRGSWRSRRRHGELPVVTMGRHCRRSRSRSSSASLGPQLPAA